MRRLTLIVVGTMVGILFVFANLSESDGPTWRRANFRLIPLTPVEIAAKLTASDAADGDTFGNATISGDTALIGAWGDDTADGVDTGSVYVFTRFGDTWIEQQKLIASDPVDYPAFGSSLAISGDTLVVGTCDWASADPDDGSAHVFTRSGDTWSLEQVLTASDGEPGDIFGCDVAISGDMVAVSAVWDDHSGFTDAGSVYFFTRSGDTWTEQQKFPASDPGTGDHFGTFIALAEQIAVIASPEDDHPGMTDAGSV